MTAIKISLYGSSQEEFDGKAVTLDLTKSLRGKNLLLKMKVKYQEGKLIALPVNVELAGSFIRRAMRRGSDYVEDSFEAECRDAFVTVKPFLITRMRVSRAVRKALRDLGYNVRTLGLRRITARVVSQIEELNPDFIFNLCESLYDQNQAEMYLAGLFELFRKFRTIKNLPNFY